MERPSYEYRMETVDTTHYRLIDELNRHGRDGWRLLVKEVDGVAPHRVTLTFIRERRA